MKWSPQQQEALDAVQAWLDGRRAGTDHRQTFYLAGYAGSGKTTLAREFALASGLTTEFVAFTGKAALVLQRKGCPDARTIHSLIYVPVIKSKATLLDLEEELGNLPEGDPRRAKLEQDIEDEKLRLRSPSFTRNEASTIIDAELVVCDEVSMVGQQMGEDLLSFGVPVLVLGDPAQLPPVKEGGYFTNREPDFMLTEVHRQAAGSPVLKLATDVRSGRSLAVGDYGTSKVVPKGAVQLDEAMAHDQIICGKNATRRAINRQVRRRLGFTSDLPQKGDRLVCLRNDKDKDGGMSILNGSFWNVMADPRVDADGETMTLIIEDADEPGIPRIVSAWTHHFLGRGDELPWFRARDHQEFDYGYAITCHKAQGSQWDRVLVYDESWVFRADKRKWLYTAVTRAAEAVTIVRT